MGGKRTLGRVGKWQESNSHVTKRNWIEEESKRAVREWREERMGEGTKVRERNREKARGRQKQNGWVLCVWGGGGEVVFCFFFFFFIIFAGFFF